MFARIELSRHPSKPAHASADVVVVEGDPALLAYLHRAVEEDGRRFMFTQSRLSQRRHRLVGSLVVAAEKGGTTTTNEAYGVFPVYRLFNAMAEQQYTLVTSIAPREGPREVHTFCRTTAHG